MYRCRNCGYQIARRIAPRKCPYCGKEGTMAVEKSAQDLIEEISLEEEKKF